MKSTVSWREARTFEGLTEDGFRVTLGQATDATDKPGPSAMELVLIGAGGCAAYDVVSILEKARQDVSGVEVQLSADRADEVPKVFTRIAMHFVVRGRGVVEARVARAVELSATKYCSATQMLNKTAEVSTSFEVVEDG
ncbi:MAG: OsmC family protein [Pseudomonadota bacterium]